MRTSCHSESKARTLERKSPDTKVEDCLLSLVDPACDLSAWRKCPAKPNCIITAAHCSLALRVRSHLELYTGCGCYNRLSATQRRAPRGLERLRWAVAMEGRCRRQPFSFAGSR